MPTFALVLLTIRPFSTAILEACLSSSTKSAFGLRDASLVRYCKRGPKPGSLRERILQLCNPGIFHSLIRFFSSEESFNYLSPTFASAGFSDLASVGGPGSCSFGACPAPALASAKEQGNAPANPSPTPSKEAVSG